MQVNKAAGRVEKSHGALDNRVQQGEQVLLCGEVERSRLERGQLIGLGGIALAFISMGAQLLFFSPQFVMLILTPLLLLMTLAFTLGFVKDIKG